MPSIPYSLFPIPCPATGLRLGVMGGTFDPIHVGHLILAEQARERFELERVLFVTAACSPNKMGQPVTDAAHRLEMTRLAVADREVFECSRIEIDRGGPSYTIDTIKQVLELYGPRAEVYLLIGADECRELMTWREPYEIARLARIVVASRPGLLAREAIASFPDDLARQMTPLDMPGVDISSTELRERVRSGRSIRYLVPRAVEDYIWAKGLYRK
jgi:nicotinate-nucleotide adenylyltransferase